MNLLEDYGYKSDKILEKVIFTWKVLFEGKKSERIYFEADENSAYILDEAHNVVRSSAMGAGLLICVQIDKKEFFDRLWKWMRTNMYISEGIHKGYFAWSCSTDGEKLSDDIRPDAEQFAATALLFASHRWGNGKGIFNYEKEALSLLHNMLHSKHPLFNKENYLIRNQPDSDYSNPSFCMPHYYELYAMFADIKDAEFWNKAAGAGREYIVRSCNKKTGLSSEQTLYDGTPLSAKERGTFFSMSYRVISNIGLFTTWFGDSPDFAEIASHIVSFFDGKKIEDFMDYEVNGTPRKRKARHPVALCATIAQASLTLERCREPVSDKVKKQAKRAVKRFWETPLRKGKSRLYDNSLYFAALLSLSGLYKVY